MLETSEEICNNNHGTCPPQAACLSTRYADFDDLETVLEMCMTALAEIKDNVCEPSADKCRKVVFFSWSQAPCILLEKSGDIIGFVGLKTAYPEYSEQAFIGSYMWYIKPENRSFKALKTLSESLKTFVKSAKLPFYSSNILHGLSATREKVIAELGYSVIGIEVKYA